jgi:hypothetical protein
LIFVLLAVLKNALLGPLVTKVFRPLTEGAQHVPDKGAAIIASNHLSFADWLFMPLALDRRTTFVAKSDYYFTRVLIGDAGDSFGDHWHRYHRATRQDHHQDRQSDGEVRRALDFSRYEGMREDRFILRSITDEIM